VGNEIKFGNRSNSDHEGHVISRSVESSLPSLLELGAIRALWIRYSSCHEECRLKPEKWIVSLSAEELLMKPAAGRERTLWIER
jgi:hypothetical protein